MTIPNMQPGHVLQEKYQIVSSIGRGGMGEVFHAVHLASNTDVAIKVVSRLYVGDLLMARLEREASAAARIQSEYIPRVLEVDRSQDGELYMVMELLRGLSLSEHLKQNGGMLSWEEVSQIGDHLLRGLMDAHAAGVVHRDLKPGNVFIEILPDGRRRARILDFGVCKLDGGEEVAEKLTVTGESVGTIAYMAPEQIRGASKVDERADLYSFAMVVFEAVSGRLAYDASGQMALLASKLERSARSLRGVAQVPIPRGLDALINRSLSREPQNRPASARDMLRIWSGLGPATMAPSSLPIVTNDGLLNAPTQNVLTAGTINTAVGMRSARWPMMLAGVVVFLGVIVAVGAARHRPAADATPELAAPSEESVAAVAPSASPADGVAVPQAGEEAMLELGPNVGASARRAQDLEAGARPTGKPRAVHFARPAAPPRKPAGSGPTIVEKPRY